MSDPAEPGTAAAPGRRLVRFNRNDGLFVAACLAVLAISVGIAVKWRTQAFPEASIDFKVTRDQSGDVARAFLAAHGLVPRDAALPAHHAAIFDWDDTQRLFLERSFGLGKANAMLAGEVRLWEWSHRWFTPLQKEEWRVAVTPGGEVKGFRHLLAEDAPGADLSEAEARALADKFFTGDLGRSSDAWVFLSAQATKRPHRTDYTFTWKRTGMTDLDPLDASYRGSVTIQGSAVGGFGEWLEVPEKWTRDYESIRSRNETAGSIDSVFLLLTALAMVVVFLVQVRRRNVPWRLALTLGAVGAVLAAASSLNSAPQAAYGFATTNAWSSFVLSQAFDAVLAGLGLAFVAVFFTAAGEPLYRADLKGQLQLGAYLSLRGLRTRSFFRSVLLGVTLCGFFIAYQVVFYLVASRHGAWAPQDVKYDALLNTAFPWTTVLLIGFLPAISEEFMSRMFSIPLLTGLLRSRVAAVVLAAFIWGFGHATYPNQPFWIRGIEVGVGGVIIGFLMLRFGILATLVWHYTVDSLYTGLSLLQSHNWYFRITAGVAIGWTLVPLALALAAYARRGGFEPEAELLNERKPGPAPPPEPARVEPPVAPVPRLRAGWTVGAFALLAAGIAAMGFHASPLDHLGDMPLSRADAVRTAEDRLRSAWGVDPSAWKSCAWLDSDMNPVACKYVLSRHPSLSALADTYSKDLFSVGWHVRFFQPGQKEEYAVRVDKTGAVVSEWHSLAYEAPGADLSEDAARKIASDSLAAAGHDVTTPEWQLKEHRSDARPKRRDWTFEWENGESYRRSVVVCGDRVAEHSGYLHVPEEFARDRVQVGFVRALLWVLKSLAALALLGAGVAAVVVQFRRGALSWRLMLLPGAVVGAAMAVVAANGFTAAAVRYDTTMPWSLWKTSLMVGLIALPLAASFGAALLVGTVLVTWPGRARPLSGHLLDALAAAAALIGSLLLLRVLGAAAWDLWVASAIPGGPQLPAELATTCPTLAVAGQWLIRLVVVPAVLGLGVWLWTGWAATWWRRAAVLTAVVALGLPDNARTTPEWIYGIALAILYVLVPLAVALVWLRGNALAYVLAPALAAAREACQPLLLQPCRQGQLAGAAAGVIMLLVLALIAWRARRAPEPAAAAHGTT